MIKQLFFCCFLFCTTMPAMAWQTNQSGLIAEYFSGKQFEHSVRKETIPNIYFDWGSAAPEGLPVDVFSARFTGELRVPQDGDYTLYLHTDDGTRLWIDGELVMDYWKDQYADFSVSLYLQKSKTYNFKLEYYENFGGAACQLSWSSANIDKQPIPASAFASATPPPLIETADIELLNISNTQTFDYPLVILRGKCDVTATEINIQTVNGNQVLPVVSGLFKGVVLLQTGENKILLKTAKKQLSLKLTYQTSTIPKTVRMVYVLAADDDEHFLAPQGEPNDLESAKKRLQWAGLMLQSATAEMMYKATNKRVTFRLQEDKNGLPLVKIVRLPLTEAELYPKNGDELYSIIANFLSKQGLMDAKNVTLMGFTSYDATRHEQHGQTALGGGELGLFGSGTLHTWAQSLEEIQTRFLDTRRINIDQLPDDSAFRGTHWANYATGLGAIAHELGHCFGLPHTDYGIMSRGFDNINRLFCISEPKMNEALDIENEAGAVWHPSSADILSTSDWFITPRIIQVKPLAGYNIGWKADYFDGRDFTSLAASRTDRSIAFEWADSPIEGVGSDNFSVRWQGKIMPIFSEEHTFTLVGDDGIRLWLDGQLLIDAWYDQAPSPYTATLRLEKGKLYTVKVEYYEAGGGATCKLYWQSPNLSKEILQNVYHTAK